MSDINALDGTEYDEVLEEVTDDEQGDEQTPGDTEGPADVDDPVLTSAPSNVHGKVNPSAEVKALKMETPESKEHKGKPAATVGTPSGPVPLKLGKNPFEKRGDWTEDTFKQLTINIPSLGSANESTNELTRDTKPESRFWKGIIRFGFSGFTSETIRFDNVHIPYLPGADYGQDYAYFCLPGFCADIFAEAGKSKGPTTVHENRVVPDSKKWWKIGNKLEEKVGVAVDGKFIKKPLQTIFASAPQGVTVNLVARFHYKSRTEDKSLIKPTTPRSVSMDVVRAYLVKLRVDVEPPTRTQRSKKVEKVQATTKDVATDKLMEELNNMGL